MDSGVTDHFIKELDKLTLRKKYQGKDKVQVADGACLSKTNIGHSHFPTSNRSLHLKNILHVPHINKNLLFVHRFASDNKVFF